jgi:hypothetical protein
MIFTPKPDNVSQEDYDKACSQAYSQWTRQNDLADLFDVIAANLGQSAAWELVYGITPLSNVKFESRPTGRLIGEKDEI